MWELLFGLVLFCNRLLDKMQARYSLMANFEVKGSFLLCRGHTTRECLPIILLTTIKRGIFRLYTRVMSHNLFIQGVYCQIGIGVFRYRKWSIFGTFDSIQLHK